MFFGSFWAVGLERGVPLYFRFCCGVLFLFFGNGFIHCGSRSVRPLAWVYGYLGGKSGGGGFHVFLNPLGGVSLGDLEKGPKECSPRVDSIGPGEGVLGCFLCTVDVISRFHRKLLRLVFTHLLLGGFFGNFFRHTSSLFGHGSFRWAVKGRFFGRNLDLSDSMGNRPSGFGLWGYGFNGFPAPETNFELKP